VTEKHLNQVELARRWSLSPRTLERWRWRRQGPPFLRIGGRVVYRMSDVETFEASRLHQTAAPPEPLRAAQGTVTVGEVSIGAQI
jgi:hypothetical protein